MMLVETCHELRASLAGCGARCAGSLHDTRRIKQSHGLHVGCDLEGSLVSHSSREMIHDSEKGKIAGGMIRKHRQNAMSLLANPEYVIDCPDVP